MAQRRMFSLKIVDTDAFLDMPQESQLLYFHLSMRADDEGFVSSPRRIMTMVGANNDSLKILVAKRFIITFNNGVCVVKHWNIHNYIKKDRFIPTMYTKELQALTTNKNGAYTEMDTKCIQNVSKSGAQVRLELELELGKARIQSSNKYKNNSIHKGKTPSFIKPSITDINQYCTEKTLSIDAEAFFDFYTSKNWYVGKNKMKDWKAALRNWARRDYSNHAGSTDKATYLEGI